MTTVSPPEKYEATLEDDTNVKDDNAADIDDTTCPVLVVNEAPHIPRKKVAVARSTGRSCCCICGYITVSIIGLILLLILAVSIMGYYMIAETVRWVTVDTPMIDIPIIIASKEEIGNTINKIMNFIDCIDSSENVHNISMTKDFILPSRFLNEVLADWDRTRGYAQVVMKSNELLLQTSFPLHYMIPGGKNRFFVSTLNITTSTSGWLTEQTTITVSFDLGKKLYDDYEGPLLVNKYLSYFDDTIVNHRNSLNYNNFDWVINVISLQIFGAEVLTPDFLAQKMNIIDEWYDDPNKNDSTLSFSKFVKVMNGIESIRIEPDQLVIRPRKIHRYDIPFLSHGISQLQRIFKLK